jgi:uncharacterized repeat protein (TIGR02543 family)
MSKNKRIAVIVTCTVVAIAALLLCFKPWERYTLSVSISPPEAGSVSPSGGQYESGVQVTLTANPASGYAFDHWSGNASGAASGITITMDSDKSVTANFKTIAQTYTLTTSISPSGAGSVSPSGGEYESGVQVALTASPASGYTFDHWSGNASGATSGITITMDSDKSVTANFKTITQPRTLTTNIDPPGAGSVSPSGGEYESGVQVTLTASPANGYTFDHWSGSASGTTSTITITMDSDKSLTAHFETSPPVPEVLFLDDFSDEAGVWDTFSNEDGSVAHENGWLHLVNYASAAVVTDTYAHQYFTDFVLEVETKLVGGTDDNWHQVFCRNQDDDNYYEFSISADGYYYVSRYIGGQEVLLAGAEAAYSSYIHQGQGLTNLIHVECIGSILSLSVNGHVLATVTDATFAGGDIGLGASALSGTFTEIAFDNIVVSAP